MDSSAFSPRGAWRPTYAKAIFAMCVLYGVYLHWDIWTLDIQGTHTWRQAATMWNVRNFARYDFNILNPRAMTFTEDGEALIQRLEFPILQYFIATLYKLFGEHIAIARATVYAVSVAGALGLALGVRDLTGNAVAGALTAGLYLNAPVLFYYSVCPLPDLLALAASWWYLRYALRYFRAAPPDRRRADLVLASVALMVATWAKIPYLMISVVSIYYFVRQVARRRPDLRGGVSDALLQLGIITPALAWYAWVIPTWAASPTIQPSVMTVFRSEDAGEWLDLWVNQFLPQRLLGGWSVPFAVLGAVLVFLRRSGGWWLTLLLMTVLYYLLEYEAIANIHDYYMLPFMLPAFAAVGFAVAWAQRFGPWAEVGLVLLVAYAGYTAEWKSDIDWSPQYTYFDANVLAYSRELEALAPRDSLVLIMRDVSANTFGWRIDKRGFVLDQDSIPAEWLADYIDRLGVSYLYSNQAKVNNDPALAPQIDSLLGTFGTVQVFRLRERRAR